MKKSRMKIVLSLVLVLVISTTMFFSVTYADGTKKMLEAWYGMTNISHNNVDLTAELEPISINQTTYLPLRKMANLFNMDILWDQSTRTVILTDKPDPEITELKTQIALKDAEIAKLQEQIRKLQTMDIDDLEDALNDEFEEYEDIEFYISLSGDEDEVEVEIEVEVEDFEDEWNALSKTKIRRYVEDICDAILEVYKDADISGSIVDSSTRKSPELYTFTINSLGLVKLEEVKNNDIDDLLEMLEDDYVSDFDDIEMEIELEGDEDELDYILYVDLDEYEDEYIEYLDDGDIKDLMLDIYYAIKGYDGFKNCTITGYIIDTDTDDEIARCYKTSSGGVTFKDKL